MLEKGRGYGRVEARDIVLVYVVRGVCESSSTFDELVTAEPAKGHTRSGVLGGSRRSKYVSASVPRSHCLASTASLSGSRPPDSTRRPSPLASRDDRGPGKAASQKSAIPCQLCWSGRDCRYPVHRERERSSLRRGGIGVGTWTVRHDQVSDALFGIESQGESKSGIVTVRRVGNMVGQCT